MAGFDPKPHLIQLKGKWYLETKWRIAWFREDHPRGCISTEVLSYDPALVKATIYSAEGEVLAMAHAGAVDKGNAVWSGKTFEKAETAAIGRALGHAGYGTQFASSPGREDVDHEDGKLADSPIERRNGRRDTRTAAERLGNGGDRRVSTTTNEAPKAGDVPHADDLRDKTVASLFIQRWRAQSLSNSEVLAALGVSKLSEWTKGREAADAAVNAWLAGNLTPEADDDTADNTPTAQLGEFQKYEAHGVLIQKLASQTNNHNYVIKCFGNVNIVTYSGDAFRKAGMSESQLDMWKKLGKWDFDTKVYVYARQVTNSKGNVSWEIERVDLGKEVLTEMDKQFNAI